MTLKDNAGWRFVTLIEYEIRDNDENEVLKSAINQKVSKEKIALFL